MKTLDHGFPKSYIWLDLLYANYMLSSKSIKDSISTKRIDEYDNECIHIKFLGNGSKKFSQTSTSTQEYVDGTGVTHTVETSITPAWNALWRSVVNVSPDTATYELQFACPCVTVIDTPHDQLYEIGYSNLIVFIDRNLSGFNWYEDEDAKSGMNGLAAYCRFHKFESSDLTTRSNYISLPVYGADPGYRNRSGAIYWLSDDVKTRLLFNAGLPTKSVNLANQVQIGIVMRNHTDVDGIDFMEADELSAPTLQSIIDAGNLGFSKDQLESKLAEFYFESAEQLRLSSNNIANIRDVSEIVSSLRNPLKLLENTANALKKQIGKKGFKDAWLKYRYVYNTTKSDIQDASSKLGQTVLTDRDTIVVRDQIPAAAISGNDTVVVHAKFVAEEDLSKVSEASLIWAKLTQLGLQPDLYNIWDMVPFSFVVDWFLPIGDFFEEITRNTWLATMPYRTKLLVSIKGETSYSGWHIAYYHRYAHDIGNLTYNSDSNTKAQTWIKRGVDLWALRK